MALDWKDTITLASSLGLGIIAFLDADSRLSISIIFTGMLLIYFIYGLAIDIRKQQQEITKLTEKLKIHEQLINLTGRVSYLESELKK